MNSSKYQAEYGIYTVSDENFFSCTVASINALRYYGYRGPVAIIDIGFLPWMRDLLAAMPGVQVLDMEPVKRNARFTDKKTDENPVMTGWAFKAFGILHYNLFRRWTYIDGDYLPLCNLEATLRPLAEAGHFVSAEDGENIWDSRHEEAIGVRPGSYMNINAGLITVDMDVHSAIIHEWRDLMTRRKPFDLWYGDQGALNAILDKWDVNKHVLDKVLWNQTGLGEPMAKENKCRLVEEPANFHVRYVPNGERIMGWHGTGWSKLWHQIGIDHYRKDEADRLKFFEECQGKSPGPILKIFEYFLFTDQYHLPPRLDGHLLKSGVSSSETPRLCDLAHMHRSDKCPAINHSYTPLYDALLHGIRSSAESVGEIGIGNTPLMSGFVSDYKVGASLYMWRDYFPNAQIFGFDIVATSIFQAERITTYHTDASNEQSLRKGLSQGAPFDLLVDDGSHELSHQKMTRRIGPDYLNFGGYLIIEDIHINDIEELAAPIDGCDILFVHRGNRGYQDNFVCFRKKKPVEKN